MSLFLRGPKPLFKSSAKKLFGALLLGLSSLFFYQNCGNVNLLPNPNSIESGSLISPESRGVVPLPSPTSGELRAVFFVDSSRSMMEGTCQGSLDIAALDPQPTGVACDPEIPRLTGVDHDFKRVRIIRQWISELEEVYANQPELLAKVKIMVIPFSGGRPQNRLNTIFSEGANALPASIRFSSLNEAKRALDRIETIQGVFANLEQHKPDPIIRNQNISSIQNYIGTSAPAPQLDRALNLLKTELDTLKNQHDGGRIEYVFISDGVPKPRGEHIREAAYFIWSSLTERRLTGRCLLPPNGSITPNPNDPVQIPCIEPEYQIVGFNQCLNSTCGQAVYDWANTGTLTEDQQRRCDECIDALASISPGTSSSFFDEVNTHWGEPVRNTAAGIFSTLGKIKTQQDRYPSVTYRFNFLRLDTTSPINFATPENEKSPLINWIMRARSLYKSGHRHFDVLTPSVDFSLFPGISKNESYKLESIVALNLNTRINSLGNLDLDSDGDGLFDYEERQLDPSMADPSNARTNNVCLDSITYSMGCITSGCDPDIDMDGDGLNECEERTLGTSDMDFDFDGDGIPDGLEVIYGYNPTSSDKNINTSSDGVERWKMGLPSSVMDASDLYLTKVLMEPLGQKTVQDHLGRNVLVPEYAFQIQNMRTSLTRESQDLPSFYKSKTRDPITLLEDRWVGGSHPQGVNRILILGKVVSVQNIGDFYWIGKIVHITHDENGQVLNIDMDDLKPIFAQDP